MAGVEPSPIATQRIRAQGLPVFSGTLEQYVSSLDATPVYDLITANHVLEHVPDPVETLRAMLGLLADDGIIWIAVPNAQCFFARSLRWQWYSADLPLHIQQFSMGSMALCGQRAGLEVERIYTYSLPAAVSASAAQWLRRRLFVPKRLTQRWGWFNGSWLGPRMDAANTGEALLVEFRKASAS